MHNSRKSERVRIDLWKVDTQDGIRIDWPNSWVHARPSNTEPIMRIIAEAPDQQTAESKIAAVQSVVDRTLKKEV
ncbi:MAG TPA: hypothetical protein VFE58_10750 [Tepidisphaeraceae bacterium]|nr:hypothetical protein [Tepidisphaeraceae bacterium]